MFRRLVLWWKVRRCERDLKFLRDMQRQTPDDPDLQVLIPVVEQKHQELQVEAMCRRRGWHWSFTCVCCGRENIAYIRPVACRYCGLNAPPDMKLTVDLPDTSNGQAQEKGETGPCCRS